MSEARTLPVGLPAEQVTRVHASWTLTAGAVLVSFWVCVAVLAPLISPFRPDHQILSATLQAPSWVHWLGTDNFGRDILSRVIWGARIDLLMGVLAMLFSFIIGTSIGALAGYYGGWIDIALMRLLDVTMSFPFFVLIIAIVAVLGAGLVSFFIAVALVGWVSYARLVRSQFLFLKKADFVTAARSLGFSNVRIIVRHVLPHALAPAIVFSMSDVVLDILLGASLSYLGLGVPPPTAEWGLMIAESQNFIGSAWWLTVFPGLAIILLALGFSLLADGVATRLGVSEQ